MQRPPLSKNTTGGQRPRVDRFVAPRDSLEGLRLRNSLNVCEVQSLDIWCAKYIQSKKYSIHLKEAFGIKVPQHQLARSKEQFLVQPWPCAPRKKHYLSSADSILDLPSYSNIPFPDILDWSSDNILVAAIGTNYHKWSWRTQSLVDSGYSQHLIQCCKFDPRGEFLLLGTSIAMVEIHDNVNSKFFNAAICGCSRHLIEPRCSITALDWSPTGNSFVTGCSLGTITSFTRNARPIASVGYIRKMVLTLKVSPNARRLAVSVIDHPKIFIYTWPELEAHSSIGSPDWTTKVFAWHPWRTAFLGIGAMYDDVSELATWNVNTDTINYMPLSYNHYALDTLLFSHRTGEMVVSLWHIGSTTSNPKSRSHLVVLSDPETVVDQWGEGRSGLDRIRTMVFSPDGTKLATATADEDLIIWNFLPEDKHKKNRTDSRRLSAMPVFLDEAQHGVSIR